MNLKAVPIRKTEFHGEVKIPKEYFEKTGIIDLKKVQLNFTIEQDNDQNDVLNLSSQGIFLLEDARTLEIVEYPFAVSLEEKIEEESEICGRFLTNSQNTLDILDILWENIVLEIPISYTVSEELKSEGNEGWNIVGEECMDKIDPRLAPLMELLDKEKE